MVDPGLVDRHTKAELTVELAQEGAFSAIRFDEMDIPGAHRRQHRPGEPRAGAEIDQAGAEMLEKRVHVSSVERDGFAIGLTQNIGGTQFFSAYAAGFWLGLLNIGADGAGTLHGLSVPPFLLYAIGTEREAEACALAGQVSAYHLRPDEAFCKDLGEQLDRFRELMQTDKKSLHVTPATLTHCR